MYVLCIFIPTYGTNYQKLVNSAFLYYYLPITMQQKNHHTHISHTPALKSVRKVRA